MYIIIIHKNRKGMRTVNEDEKDFKVDLNGFDDSEINLDDFAEIIHDLDEENEQKDEQDEEQENTSEKSRTERNAERRGQGRKSEPEPEQEEGLKDKKDEKENDVSFREKFMEGVKKAPVYAAGVILAVIGLIRQAIRAILFGPSYARRTEEEFGKKIDELRNSEELEKENHDREKEKEEQEKNRKEQDKDKDRENNKDERERDDKDEESKDEETVETEQQPDSEDLLEEKETSAGEEPEENESEEKDEEEDTRDGAEEEKEKEKEEEEKEDENETKENLNDEKKEMKEKAEGKREEREPEFVIDEKSQENIPETESDKKAIYENVFGTENPFTYANDERKQKPEHFSTEAMTSKDICGLLQTKHAREAMQAIEESFGVQLRFSKDMTQINLVDTNAELENRQFECENESHTEKSTFHFTTYPESAISRPIDTMLFLKGDITQMAAACKDIGCELHGSNESETSSDSRNIMAAAMITAKFRQDTLHEYQADGIHKTNRNSSVLAYLPKTFSINGEKDDKTQKYDIHSVKIGKEGNGGHIIEVLSDERKDFVLDCKSVDLICKTFTEHDNGTMALIENLADFPPENELSGTQLFQTGKVMDALRNGQYLKDYMSVYGGTQEDVKLVMDELETEVLDIIRSIPFGLTNSQMESCERINNMYSQTANLVNQSLEELAKSLDQMDSEMEESSRDELDTEQDAETDDVLSEESQETETESETETEIDEQDYEASM